MVASVAGTSNGVAPGAMLGSYRVFGCQGYVGDEVLIEGIDRAVRDGCDIINLSLASGSGYAETVRAKLQSWRPPQQAACCQPRALAAQTAVEKHHVARLVRCRTHQDMAPQTAESMGLWDIKRCCDIAVLWCAAAEHLQQGDAQCHFQGCGGGQGSRQLWP
jgi:hypothetical protein